jgi:predicted GH43/DUF377 family glycosyl hydrolase
MKSVTSSRACNHGLHLDYGAANTSIALASGSVHAMLEWWMYTGRMK